MDVQEGTADEEMVFEPPSELHASAHIRSLDQYRSMYARSLAEPAAFWADFAAELHFHQNSDAGLAFNFDARRGPVSVSFMEGARTNVAFNCLERNIERGLGNKIAFHWEGNEIGDEASFTYQQLLDSVVGVAKLMRASGVKKGDRVAVYLPMVVELPVVMLACARIGAIHSVVFAGFSAEALASRIVDARANILFTADAVARGSKLIQLKRIADEAMAISRRQGHAVGKCVVVKHVDRVKMHESIEKPEIAFDGGVDVWFDEAVASAASANGAVEWLDAEEPLFMLYTSGSTGKPKGVVHTQAGYMCYCYATCKLTFDLRPDDVYWCAADCGWITGHSYIVYGPLLNGVTGLVFEGIPTYPEPSRCWQIVQKYKLTKMYTAPTAIRALMSFGNDYVTPWDRSSLQVLGTVGEPINPAAWLWYYEVVGDKRCAIVDTYWQTETGGHVVTPLPGATPTKPGSATLPFFGVEPVLLDSDGAEIVGPGEGNLVRRVACCPTMATGALQCIQRAWPGMMRTVYGDHGRFEKTYFGAFPGYYFTGDGARRDTDGYLWITGRVDDLMNVSGHLLSTAEIESALVAHPHVSEAAVVAAPHDIKGCTPYAFVTLRVGLPLTAALVDELKAAVRRRIGAIAVPEAVQQAPSLPKTRSGKITRRILRKIAEGDRAADLGDVSTLADETVIAQLWDGRANASSG